MTHLIGLSFVWRVFGGLAFVWHSLRCSFLGKLSWSVAFVCNGLQWISIDFKRLRFCRSVCRFLYRTRVDLVFVFASGLIYREARGMCNDYVGFVARVSQHIVDTFIADASRPMSCRIVV